MPSFLVLNYDKGWTVTDYLGEFAVAVYGMRVPCSVFHWPVTN